MILSDLGANTLLLHPDVWFKGEPVPNRLRLLREWVAGGGGLMMIGGYYSFQGINAGARYHRTPVEAGAARSTACPTTTGSRCRKVFAPSS